MKKIIITLSLALLTSTANAGTGSVEEQQMLLSLFDSATPAQKLAINYTVKQLPLPKIKPIIQTTTYVSEPGPYGMVDLETKEYTKTTVIQPRNAYIVINIPAFTLYAIEDEKVVLTSKVIVGKGSNESDKTPIMTTKITSIAWNPYWAPPYRYDRLETQAKWIKDNLYLAKNKLSIIRNADHSILQDDEITKETFLSYEHTIVQTPGDDNMLGKALFYLDNPHSVYMHDTNNPALFNQKNRNFSMGCIRVQEWLHLASWILKKPQESIQNEIETGKMLFNWPEQPLPVYVVYWPVDIIDGSVVYYNDIYKWVK